MNGAKRALLVAFCVIFLLATAAILDDQLSKTPSSTPEVSSMSGSPIKVSPGALYSATFTDTAGKIQSLGQWQGKLLVVNFWASWCAPCKEEMPLFSRLHAQHAANGLQIVGIAADSAANVEKFQRATPMTYPLLPDESGAIAFSKRLGNRFGLLPHTVIFSPSGEQLFAKLGIVTEAELEAIIDKNLPKNVK